MIVSVAQLGMTRSETLTSDAVRLREDDADRGVRIIDGDAHELW